MPDELRINFLKDAGPHGPSRRTAQRCESTITRLDERRIAGRAYRFSTSTTWRLQLANDLEISHLNGNMDFDYDIPFDCYIKANYTLVSAALLNLVKMPPPTRKARKSL